MRIVQVDPSTSKEVLNYLQVTCLPYDVPDYYGSADIWLVCMDNGIPAAFGCIRLLDGDNEGTWYLSRVGVIPPYRGRGLQVRMHLALEKKAKEKGAEVIVSDNTTLNPASTNSFIKTKYKPFYPAYPWGLPDSMYWIKTL